MPPNIQRKLNLRSNQAVFTISIKKIKVIEQLPLVDDEREIEEKALVVHGNIATAAGCLAAIDLVGFIIEKLLGAEVKEDVIASVQPVGKGLECIY